MNHRFMGTNVVQRLGEPIFTAGMPEAIKARVFAVRDALTIAGGR